MRVYGFAILLVAVGGLGCGRTSPPTTSLPPIAQVHGKVLYRGKATEGITVEFHPLFDMGSIKFSPEGKTGADGAFTLVSGHGGVPVGEYAVTFTFLEVTDPGDAGGTVDRWKGRYSGPPAKSRFKVTIKEGDNQLEPFKLD